MVKAIIRKFNSQKEVVDDWWNSWHRFAEEDDEPPVHIKILIRNVEKDLGLKFSLSRGLWK